MAKVATKKKTRKTSAKKVAKKSPKKKAAKKKATRSSSPKNSQRPSRAKGASTPDKKSSQRAGARRGGKKAGAIIADLADEDRERLNAILAQKNKDHGDWNAETRAEAMIKFLTALNERPNVRIACQFAGIRRRLAYKWKEDYPEFAEMWKEAKENSLDLAEDEVWRRGVEGVDKPVVYKGEITNTYKEYSDRCLEMLLRARRSAYREKRELTGPEGGPIQVQAVERRVIDHQMDAQ